MPKAIQGRRENDLRSTLAKKQKTLSTQLRAILSPFIKAILGTVVLCVYSSLPLSTRFFAILCHFRREFGRFGAFFRRSRSMRLWMVTSAVFCVIYRRVFFLDFCVIMDASLGGFAPLSTRVWMLILTLFSSVTDTRVWATFPPTRDSSRGRSYKTSSRRGSCQFVILFCFCRFCRLLSVFCFRLAFVLSKSFSFRAGAAIFSRCLLFACFVSSRLVRSFFVACACLCTVCMYVFVVGFHFLVSSRSDRAPP